jgi:hypothetical protein
MVNSELTIPSIHLSRILCDHSRGVKKIEAVVFYTGLHMSRTMIGFGDQWNRIRDRIVDTKNVLVNAIRILNTRR